MRIYLSIKKGGKPAKKRASHPRSLSFLKVSHKLTQPFDLQQILYHEFMCFASRIFYITDNLLYGRQT